MLCLEVVPFHSLPPSKINVLGEGQLDVGAFSFADSGVR